MHSLSLHSFMNATNYSRKLLSRKNSILSLLIEHKKVLNHGVGFLGTSKTNASFLLHISFFPPDFSSRFFLSKKFSFTELLLTFPPQSSPRLYSNCGTASQVFYANCVFSSQLYSPAAVSVCGFFAHFQLATPVTIHYYIAVI